MKFKHTPGPWEPAGSTIRTTRSSFGGGYFVVDCSRSWAGNEFSNDEGEAEANALLIAAAPEMLEMLIEVIKKRYGQVEEYSFGKLTDIIKRATGMSIDEVMKCGG